MVVVGGYVRLSRAGLSIVEWNAVTGVVPPLGEAAWREAFAAYQQTPEGRTVNAGMALPAFQRIYLIEWFHRLLGRVAGLAVVLPLVVFVLRGTIPWRRSLPYWAIVAGFGLQGLLGWLMVSSGLVDRPSVSHYRLAAHLLAALALLAACIWLAMAPDRGDRGIEDDATARAPLRRLAAAALALVVVQIAWGGLVAGLKAGHAASTWPLMQGRWVPPGLLEGAATPWLSLVESPVGVHFVHRWLAWAVLALAVALAGRAQSERRVLRPAVGLALLVAVQIALGIAVVVTFVPLPLALLHQATGVAIFALAVVAYRRARRV